MLMDGIGPECLFLSMSLLSWSVISVGTFLPTTQKQQKQKKTQKRKSSRCRKTRNMRPASKHRHKRVLCRNLSWKLFKKKKLSYLIKRRKRKKSRKKSSCVSLSLPAEVLRVAPSSGAADVRCCSDLFYLSALAASSNPLYTRYYPDIMKRRGAHVRTSPPPTTSTPTSSSSTTR